MDGAISSVSKISKELRANTEKEERSLVYQARLPRLLRISLPDLDSGTSRWPVRLD